MKRQIKKDFIPERLEILDEIWEANKLLSVDIDRWARGSEEAGQRARVKSLKLEKLLQDFRKESMRMYKEKLSKLHA